MTANEQRIAIAEHLGWGREDAVRGFKTTGGRPGSMYKGQISDHLPDYLNDLNAMNEAESTLTDEQWLAYVRLLSSWCDTDPRPNWWRMRHAAHATAAQRAEAFLRTVGRWVD